MHHLLLAAALALAPPALVLAPPILTTTSAQLPATKEIPMTEATGPFEVRMAPTPHTPDPTIASMSLDKTFHGPLEATSKGEMLSAGDPASGNAGYVAMERVTGTLAGRTGTFALMHMGTLTKGSPPQLLLNVVPGSGTGELMGLHGTMTIAIAEGKHTYTLHYALSSQ